MQFEQLQTALHLSACKFNVIAPLAWTIYYLLLMLGNTYKDILKLIFLDTLKSVWFRKPLSIRGSTLLIYI